MMRTSSPSLRLFVFFLLQLFAGVLASDITSFTDAKCTRSWRALDAVNGYPDGLCKPLNVTGGQSFQIQELDLGCAGERKKTFILRICCDCSADYWQLRCMERTLVRWLVPLRRRSSVIWRHAMTRRGSSTQSMDVCLPTRPPQAPRRQRQQQPVSQHLMSQVQHQCRESRLASSLEAQSLGSQLSFWAWQ